MISERIRSSMNLSDTPSLSHERLETERKGTMMSGAEVYGPHGCTSLSRTTIWRAVRAGNFPVPLRLTGGRVAWLRAEVHAWMDGRPRTRVTAPSAANGRALNLFAESCEGGAPSQPRTASRPYLVGSDLSPHNI
jgi:predicted DNA-binding transcriptional regulator AlpA